LNLIKTLNIEYRMKRSTEFYLNLVTILAGWPVLVTQILKVVASGRSMSASDLLLLLGLGLGVPSAVFRIRRMALAQETSGPKLETTKI
jgi:hypothetical protein